MQMPLSMTLKSKAYLLGISDANAPEHDLKIESPNLVPKLPTTVSCAR